MQRSHQVRYLAQYGYVSNKQVQKDEHESCHMSLEQREAQPSTLQPPSISVTFRTARRYTWRFAIMMLGKPPVLKDLVLLGGGHSHVEVLRSFGMKPMPGVRLTLITRDMHTPYSGMLPGFISGFYSYDDCHIDLCRLANFAKARLVHAEAAGVDVRARQVLFKSRPPIDYDVLSINVGITPASEAVPGAQQHATAVKPIDKFAVKLDALFERFRSQGATRAAPLRVVVVGGGAGGVEVCLSLRYRLEQERKAAGLSEGMAAKLTLVCRGELLEGSPSSARSALRRSLRDHGVELLEREAAVSVQQGSVTLASGKVLPWDECVWATGASAPAWLGATGLPTNAGGFISISDTLQCVHDSPTSSSASGGSAAGGAVFSEGEVFAVGDVASCAAHPRPKAGVYAVRQGPPLTRNLRAYLSGQPLEHFVPQSTHLSLITTGDRYCVGTKGWLSLEGSWLWTWKDSIDRTFMAKYGEDLAAMEAKMMAAAAAGQAGAGPMSGGGAPQTSSWWPWQGQQGDSGTAPQLPSAFSAAGPEGLALLAEARMRCGGCGAKVGASVLSRVLARLRQRHQQHPSNGTFTPQGSIVLGLDSPDDAALVRPPPPGHLLVQTVDFFRSFWSDPYVFGRIAANHALGDCFAMGGTPRTALAVVVVPFAAESKMEGELTQMMAGAVDVLDEAGCELAGGHTCEGEEAALGFTVNGEVAEGEVMGKAGLRPGQSLILTKALGTGTLMAAAMKGKAKGRWVAGALTLMQQSSSEAARIARAHGCTACTDVTGFGLLGHLVEMAQPAQVHVQLSVTAVPLLPGVAECVSSGVLSSLHRQNVAALSAVTNAQQLKDDARWPVLVDPQTCGGLLMGVAAASAHACVRELQAAGYMDAAIIGQVQQQQVSDDAQTLGAAHCVTVTLSDQAPGQAAPSEVADGRST